MYGQIVNLVFTRMVEVINAVVVSSITFQTFEIDMCFIFRLQLILGKIILLREEQVS